MDTDNDALTCNRATNRLNMERHQAMGILEKSNSSHLTSCGAIHSTSSKQITNALDDIKRLDRTNYVADTSPSSINISELVQEKSIYLERSNSDSVLFEPSEIAWRSTLNKPQLRPTNASDSSNSVKFSVTDIIASSFAPKVRNLGEKLQNAIDTTSFMALSKLVTDSTKNDSEEFAPSELMQSKLLLDEISWAQKFATMPATVISENAKATCVQNVSNMSHKFNSSSKSNSVIASGSNYSLGQFFDMRSENIREILECTTPKKSRSPFALIACQETRRVTEFHSKAQSIEKKGSSSAIPGVSKKRHNKNGKLLISSTITPPSVNYDSFRHSFDELEISDGESRNLDFSTISAIDKVLNGLELDKSENRVTSLEIDTSLTENFSCFESKTTAENKILKNELVQKHKKISKYLPENEENVNPKAINDTYFSNINKSVISKKSSDVIKSPKQLSIIDPIPLLEITSSLKDVGHDADIDEWPGSPIKSPHRRIKRTKSPQIITRCKAAKESEWANEANHIQTTQKQSHLPKMKIEYSNAINFCNDNSYISSKFSPTLPLDKKETSSLAISQSYIDINSKGHIEGQRSADKTLLQSPENRTSNTFSSSHDCGTTNSEVSLTKIVLSPVTTEPSTSPISSSCNSHVLESSSRETQFSKRNWRCHSIILDASPRSISRSSSSSEFSHRDGKFIPLKVTTLELSWSSTKLRTNVKKSMQIKNTSRKRLSVRIEVNGPGFQLVNSNGNTLNLHTQECRTIVVNFCPTVIGVAIGNLSFYSPLSSSTYGTSFLDIPLYGYGGHCSVITQGILQGPVGNSFISMGKLHELSYPLEKSFEIYNRGPLLAFAVICIDAIGFNTPGLGEMFKVVPDRILIKPGCTQTVQISLKPSREDIKKIFKKTKNVLTLANMHLVTGDEANRLRMRRLVRQMSAEEVAKVSFTFSPMLNKLWSKFPFEENMLDIEMLKEDTKVISDLFATVRNSEVALTINNYELDDSLNDSASLFFLEEDDTVLFRTICTISPSTLEPVNENDLESSLKSNMSANGNEYLCGGEERKWSISPNILEWSLGLQQPLGQIVTIKNFMKSIQYFEVACNHAGLLSLTPCKGKLEPNGGQIDIEIQFSLNNESKRIFEDEIIIMVQLGKERTAIPVKITRCK